jgi:hypothetical protein
MVSAADRFPAVVGLKATHASQLLFAARLAPQVMLEISKSPGFAPETEMLRMTTEALV